MEKTTAETELLDKYNLGELPSKGNRYVGEFFNTLWEEARDEKIIRLGLHQRWIELHKKFRGMKDRNVAYPKIGANYLFKIILSFCAILTEKIPQGDIVPDENIPDEYLRILNKETDKWWVECKLQNLLYVTVLNMLLFGTTIEKFVFDRKRDTTKIILKDPFNFFPAPGYKMCNLDIPYVCDAYFLEPWEIRKTFDVPMEVDIPTDAEEHLLGLEREMVSGWHTEDRSTSNLPSTYSVVPGYKGTPDRIGKLTLVVEIWAQDNSTETIPIYGDVQATDNTGQVVFDDQRRPVMTRKQVAEKVKPIYPDGIRKVTICHALIDTWQHGILDDSRNPSINWNLLEARKEYLMTIGIEKPVVDPTTGQPVAMQNQLYSEDEAEQMALDSVKNTWLWGRFPYSATPSMIDTSQWWGFSVIEQLEELNSKQESLLTKFFAFMDILMFPLLIIPQGSGVRDSEITNAPGTIIHPTIEAANSIRYLDSPSSPEIFEMLQFILYQMDIISMSPEVTEGRKPKGVSAASAIIALQNKAGTLFQPNIWRVGEIVESRENAHISMVLNFGSRERPIKVDDEYTKYIGTDIIGAFKYYVENGSIAPLMKQGRQQQYLELFRLGALTLRPLLEMLEIPKRIIEMVLEEKSVPGALQLLIAAGLPQEMAAQIYQVVMQNQGIGATDQKAPEGGKTPQTQPTGPNVNDERMKTIYQQMSTVG